MLYNLTYEKNITIGWAPKIQYHLDYTTPIDDTDCSYLYKVNPEDRCNFVKNTESCNEGIQLFNYLQFLFCSLPEINDTLTGRLVYYLCMVGLLLYCFLTLATTAEHFFCPSLGVLSTVFHMTESLAGVTLLSMGNGASDVFAAIASAKSDTALMIGQLYGGGMFITCIVAGCICIISPFKIYPPDMIRNLLFYIVAVSFTSTVVHSKIVTNETAIAMVLIYACFLGVVLTMHFLDLYKRREIHAAAAEAAKSNERKNQAGLKVVLPKKKDGNRERGVAVGANNDINKEEDHGEIPTHSLLGDFFYQILPITCEEWRELGSIGKLIGIFQLPLLLFLKFCLPVCNYKVHLHGWTRLLNCIHICTCPVLVLIQLKLIHNDINGFPLVVAVEIVLVIIASTVFIITDTNKQPALHDAFAFFAFIGSIMVLWATADEIVSLLRALSRIFEISDNTMGLSVMAVGNSIGDLVANILMAKQGFARMGYIACFGSPLFSVTVGMGLCFLKRISFQEDNFASVRPGALGFNCAFFLGMSLSGSLIILSLTGFVTRKSYGLWLSTLWVIFMVNAILAELEIIHPYGTDHSATPEGAALGSLIGKIHENTLSAGY